MKITSHKVESIPSHCYSSKSKNILMLKVFFFSEKVKGKTNMPTVNRFSPHTQKAISF